MCSVFKAMEQTLCGLNRNDIETWFYERLFFEVAIVMVKDKKNTIQKIQCQ